MQIRVSPGIVGPVLRGVVVVLISGSMKRSVGSMDLKSSVPSASESFVCHHGSFQPFWPELRKYASSRAMSRGTGPDPESWTKRYHRHVSRRTMLALHPRPLLRCSGFGPIGYSPAASRTKSASSHPSGVENLATPVFGTVLIGSCLPSRGSIQKLVEYNPPQKQ